MPDGCSSTQTQDELAASLKGYRLPTDCSLAIYSRQELSMDAPLANRQLCGTIGETLLCNGKCSASFRKSLLSVFETSRPTVFRCQAGMICIAIQLRPPLDASCCLVVGGIREQALDLHLLETLADIADIDPFTLLDELEKLRTPKDEVAVADIRLHPAPPRPLFDKPQIPDIQKITDRIPAITSITTDIDQAKTAAEVVKLLSEALGILFNLPDIVVALDTADATRVPLQRTWGQAEEPGFISAERLKELFAANQGASVVLSEETCSDYFPNINASSAICIPLTAMGECFGMMALPDAGLSPHDSLTAVLLTGRTAMKLACMKRDEQSQQESSLSDRLLGMISTLALTEGKDDLYCSILEMAADLVHASGGSLMLVDADKNALSIVATIGMNLRLARCLTVNIGDGIAGNVASSGNPLVVNDIEKDTRLGGRNRPRFKTKSFISLPLKFREETLGVLNLSDKNNQAVFTETDLNILTAFISHAAAMIHRSRSMEKVELFERLAVTDPLTELYNRRFLEKRMDEELNRSLRHGLNLTIMLIDLDNFKIYNDLCGHVAGDRALKKVARILTASVREMDVVTRYGGEEFCIVLPGATKNESLFVAERIRRSIETELFTGEENLPLGRLTASIGMSCFPDDGKNAGSLIKGADVALYQAKNNGRNRVVLCTTGSSLTSASSAAAHGTQISSIR